MKNLLYFFAPNILNPDTIVIYIQIIQDITTIAIDEATSNFDEFFENRHSTLNKHFKIKKKQFNPEYV